MSSLVTVALNFNHVTGAQLSEKMLAEMCTAFITLHHCGSRVCTCARRWGNELCVLLYAKGKKSIEKIEKRRRGRGCGVVERNFRIVHEW